MKAIPLYRATSVADPYCGPGSFWTPDLRFARMFGERADDVVRAAVQDPRFPEMNDWPGERAVYMTNIDLDACGRIFDGRTFFADFDGRMGQQQVIRRELRRLAAMGFHWASVFDAWGDGGPLRTVYIRIGEAVPAVPAPEEH